MREAPEAVLLYIPLMKELGMSWAEIKSTPRFELEGLLVALGQHSQLHSLDGYDAEDIKNIAKDKPGIRNEWAKYQNAKAKYESRVGRRETPKSFKGLVK
jgi:hypothetical protein